MGIDEFSKKISQDLMEKLKSHYPLRGRIVSLESRNLVLDIGADQGVKPGTKMKVLAEGKPVQIKGKMIVPKGREIGKIEITSVEPNLAYARIIEKYDDIQVGFKIEELIADDSQPTASL